ncbi:AfsR/SARP family transcriptional regulator [Kribbella solani]|uniref:DNA-binding SARP family transcriptional activator n=1 Tax=Kribbella solani TaxID=236067 RepID=A0A841DLM0_9ACTN|nr:BTAD domain-containing putative transcriptional regulator [Kribbella solani]MBB5977915.1 DNA-binding SARP family transcriptional activator [Kribbella solani]
MEFRLLGPLEVWTDGAEVRIGRRQERLVLAALLLKANEVIAPTELVDLLWPHDPPTDAAGAVQVYVSRLRKTGVPIEGTRDGYRAVVEPEAVDLYRFRRMVAEARRTIDPVERSDKLRTALVLWRGEPLADLFVGTHALAGVEEERRAAEQDRIDADLAAGRHHALADELAARVEADPLREQLVIAWMTALYRAGRKADALAAYSGLADRLAGEFGLDPAPAVRRLYLAVRRDDPALRLPGTGGDAVPRELPADISVLAGRDDLLEEAQGVLKGTARVYCLWGAAGVGKSAAATRIGHLVSAAFPDGQLFARLQDVHGAPVPPQTLLGRMLRSLGVAPRAIPKSLDDRAALFREQTADRRLLVVLDDALHSPDAELLLPTGPASAAIITSRRPLPDLAPPATMPCTSPESATPPPTDGPTSGVVHRQVLPLDADASRGLLTRLVGHPLRDHATRTLVTGCAGLPLALRIVGARLALSGEDALPTLLAGHDDPPVSAPRRRAQHGLQLDSLVAGDLAVRSSLDRTLALLDPEGQALFERLSLVGVTEFPSWVAAPLLDCDESTGLAAFERLVELGLVDLVSGQYYKLHDLVRSYSAARLAVTGNPAEPRDRYLTAVHRLTALADSQLNHGMTLASHLEVPAHPVLGVAEQQIADDPTLWFGRTWQLIGTAAFTALESGNAELAGKLGIRLNGYHVTQELLEPRIELLEAVRDALKTAGPFELYVRTEIALLPAYHRSPRELLTEGTRLLELAVQAESPYLQVRALVEMSHGARWAGEPELALTHSTRALALIDQPGGPESMRSVVLRTLASAYTDLHDYAAAQEWFEQILQLSVPGSMMEGLDLAILGEIKMELGELGDSEQLLRRAAANFRSVSSYYHLAWPTALLARLAVRRQRADEAAQLVAEVNSWFETLPWSVEIHLRAAEADLAIATGNQEAGREILLATIKKAEARGDSQFATAYQQILDAHDQAD